MGNKIGGKTSKKKKLKVIKFRVKNCIRKIKKNIKEVNWKCKFE